jgi:hypothetical protein
MPTYDYIARTNDGTLEKGTVEAKTPERARENLRKRNLMVEELKEQEGETIGFAGAMPWTTTDDDIPDAAPAKAAAIESTDAAEYIPLADTLRLFAGWLLAWYALVYLLGSYRLNGKIPFEVPFLQGLFESPLVLRFAFGTFLFLMLTNIHAWMGKGTGKGIVLTVIWIVLVALFHLNA